MIYLRDDLPPESLAMLQALYSRSPASVVEHIKKVEEVGADKFMSRYYVGYGHRSIGDCGSTTLFVEDVSLLAAKAIQNWPLYSGQEASTRYMDFSNARIEDPVGTSESEAIQERWMQFYHSAQQPMLDHLHAQFPRKEGEAEDVYERAINARKFDVLRAFLPAGATTNLSWHTNLRQADDHLEMLCRHPDPTIQRVAQDIFEKLIEKYPSSFKRGSREDVSVIEWNERVARDHTYLDDDARIGQADVAPRMEHTIGVPRTHGSSFELLEYKELLSSRPARAELPHFLDELGQITTRFLLDFGSFRDLQRHRNGVVRMPLLSRRWGFEPWYFDQMPVDLQQQAGLLLETQGVKIAMMKGRNVPPVVQQYYCAMGYRVACKVTQTLPAFIYRIELRTSPSVHQTLRKVAQMESLLFKTYFPEWLKLHADMSLDTWDVRRGKQTIVER